MNQIIEGLILEGHVVMEDPRITNFEGPRPTGLTSKEERKLFVPNDPTKRRELNALLAEDPIYRVLLNQYNATQFAMLPNHPERVEMCERVFDRRWEIMTSGNPYALVEKAKSIDSHRELLAYQSPIPRQQKQ